MCKICESFTVAACEADLAGLEYCISSFTGYRPKRSRVVQSLVRHGLFNISRGFTSPQLIANEFGETHVSPESLIAPVNERRIWLSGEAPVPIPAPIAQMLTALQPASPYGPAYPGLASVVIALCEEFMQGWKSQGFDPRMRLQLRAQEREEERA